MSAASYELLGIGLYTVPEASRLAAVSPARIRRWLKGYSYVAAGEQRSTHELPPVLAGDLAEIDGRLALSFRDLIEVRFVNAFIEHGVSWPTLRRVVERARAMMETKHPFATQRFATDGRSIFAEIIGQNGETKLLDLAKSQFAFRRVISPSLSVGLDFSGEREVVRWWPLGRNNQVVLDPQRCFGRPIVNAGSVPTAVLASAVEAEGDQSITRVAKWFGLSRRAVSDAVGYEQKLAA